MDINDIIDSIYKLPDASKEALLSDAPEVAILKASICSGQIIKTLSSI